MCVVFIIETAFTSVSILDWALRLSSIKDNAMISVEILHCVIISPYIFDTAYTYGGVGGVDIPYSAQKSVGQNSDGQNVKCQNPAVDFHPSVPTAVLFPFASTVTISRSFKSAVSLNVSDAVPPPDDFPVSTASMSARAC